jgi:hypothetical protein
MEDLMMPDMQDKFRIILKFFTMPAVDILAFIQY